MTLQANRKTVVAHPLFILTPITTAVFHAEILVATEAPRLFFIIRTVVFFFFLLLFTIEMTTVDFPAGNANASEPIWRPLFPPHHQVDHTVLGNHIAPEVLVDGITATEQVRRIAFGSLVGKRVGDAQVICSSCWHVYVGCV